MIRDQKCEGMGLNGFISKEIWKKNIPGREKKSLEPFGICLLNSRANPAQFFIYETIKTRDLTFSSYIILALDGVGRNPTAEARA